MKVVFAFVFVILGASAHHLSSEEKLKLQKIHERCQADPSTHVDERLLMKLSENKDNAAVGAHMLCMSVGAGMQKANGDLDKEVIKSKISLVTHDRSKIDGLVEKCAINQDTLKKTAAMLWLCFIQNDVHYIYDLKA
ncbi:hypothetical protein NQ314_014907 [Rhamnusium bicolor]|uniref:Uncharacterized protein n=1 Tax=Rhamnusium bicolor TaxID=1586634 RepID=A0AAV8X2E1_9CUCU|nr:hypothetical protein NQ314_014907 [Rhamnusium bicolor]